MLRPAEAAPRWGDTMQIPLAASLRWPCPALLALTAVAAGGGAVGWRGDGTGRFPQADPPITWDGEKGTHIFWRAEVGKGQSSPVPAGGRVFVASEKDLLVCVERRTGKVLWKIDNGFGSLPEETKGRRKRPPTGEGCGYSAPTPVTDGVSVYACYGTGVVAGFDFQGKRKWVRYFDVPQVTEYGRSASPVLAGGKLLVSLGGLIALEPSTGKTLWETRKAKPAYGTPAVTRVGDVEVLVTPNGDIVRVSDGRVLASKLARATYSSPLVHAGVVYFVDVCTVALKLPKQPDGSIRLTRLWENEDLEGEFFASPVWHGGLLYCVSNEGTLYALEAGTGRIVLEKKLQIPSAGPPPGMPTANIYASLTLVGERLLLTNDIGQSLVLAPGRQYKQVARNSLPRGSGASPAADGNVLLLRGGKWLYAIGAK